MMGHNLWAQIGFCALFVHCPKEKEIILKPENRNRSVATGVAVLVVAVVLLAIDQISKYFVLIALKPVGTVTVIPGLLELTYVENTGAAFGLFKNAIWLVIAVTVIAAAVILVLLFRYKHHSFFSYTTSALLIAGGLGNLIDRIVHGFVVDFIHVLFFGYVFNFADCCITVGAVLFVIHMLFFSYKEKSLSPEGEDGK